MKNLLPLIFVIISISLQLAVVIAGIMLITECYLRAVKSETVAQMALWLTAAKFVFFSPIYAFKIYLFLKTGTWGEEGSQFLFPIKIDVLFWTGVYMFFTIIAFTSL